MFTFNIQDKTGEIGVLVAGEKTEERHAIIAVGKCYQVAIFRVKPNHARFKLTDHPYELHLTKAGTVVVLDIKKSSHK